MQPRKTNHWELLSLITGVCLVVSFAIPQALEAQSGHLWLGGPRGVVRSASVDPPPGSASVDPPLEGIMVQLVSTRNAIRTTVYTNEDGRYEFPKLDAGSYTLRIARPLEFKPYQKDSVSIDGATQLADIVLERVSVRVERNSDAELLPPTPEIVAQLTGSEMLMNLPATGEEKRRLNNSCGYTGCHTYTQILSNRFDEAGWRAILNRMLRIRPTGAANMNVPITRGSPKDVEALAKFLVRVRGPGAKDSPFRVLPRPRGTATRVIITEYELPHLQLSPHDAAGDSEGNVWYSSHRTSYIGKLNPRTGKVTTYRVPSTLPEASPGTHRILWDNNRKVIWVSQNWAHQLIKFDPRTEQFKVTQLPHHDTPLNEPGVGNVGLHPDGSIWNSGDYKIRKIDPETGKYLAEYPLKKLEDTYENAISYDGNFWCGGGTPHDMVACLDIRTGEVMELDTPSPGAKPARGAFDREGNAWFGGRGGALIKADLKKRRVTEYHPPTPYVAFYEAMPDKNGEVWAGEMHGGRFLRFNPRTERWIEYVMPSTGVRNRRTWIDESTNPVTVWYVDHDGRFVRIQPLE